jgi:hypothetical protein
MTDIMLGVQLMGYGLIGVFAVLAVFYGLIVAIRKLFPYKDDK